MRCTVLQLLVSTESNPSYASVGIQGNRRDQKAPYLQPPTNTTCLSTDLDCILHIRAILS